MRWCRKVPRRHSDPERQGYQARIAVELDPTISKGGKMSRHFCEQIEELPRPRGSIHDRHHLFWPAPDYRQLGLGSFKSLSCTSARRIDSMVHTLVHQRHAGLALSQNVIDRRELLRRAKRCSYRHEEQRCSCFRPNRIRTIDALNLEYVDPFELDRAPCLIIRVDTDIVSLMRESYHTVAPVTQAVYELLEKRDPRGGR